jgi:hypothetical protein
LAPIGIGSARYAARAAADKRLRARATTLTRSAAASPLGRRQYSTKQPWAAGPALAPTPIERLKLPVAFIVQILTRLFVAAQ